MTTNDNSSNDILADLRQDYEESLASDKSEKSEDTNIEKSDKDTPTPESFDLSNIGQDQINMALQMIENMGLTKGKGGKGGFDISKALQMLQNMDLGQGKGQGQRRGPGRKNSHGAKLKNPMKKCIHLVSEGEKKGKLCGRVPINNSSYCSRHLKNN